MTSNSVKAILFLFLMHFISFTAEVSNLHKIHDLIQTCPTMSGRIIWFIAYGVVQKLRRQNLALF